MFPAIPSLPSIPSVPSIPQTNGTTSGSGVFNDFLTKISSEIQAPVATAQSMVAGKKPFDATELISEIVQAEQKLSISVRVINDIVKGVKQLEAIQA